MMLLKKWQKLRIFYKVSPATTEAGVRYIVWDMLALQTKIGINGNKMCIQPSTNNVKRIHRSTNGHTVYRKENTPSHLANLYLGGDMQGKGPHIHLMMFVQPQLDRDHSHSISTSWGDAIHGQNVGRLHNSPAHFQLHWQSSDEAGNWYYLYVNNDIVITIPCQRLIEFVGWYFGLEREKLELSEKIECHCRMRMSSCCRKPWNS